MTTYNLYTHNTIGKGKHCKDYEKNKLFQPEVGSRGKTDSYAVNTLIGIPAW